MDSNYTKQICQYFEIKTSANKTKIETVLRKSIRCPNIDDIHQNSNCITLSQDIGQNV